MNRIWNAPIIVLITLSLVSIGCSKKATNSVSAPGIEGVWYLKQGTEESQLFVSDKEELGARRFYTRLQLADDGTFELIVPGPSDRPSSIKGSWKWESQNALLFQIENREIIIKVLKAEATSLTLNQLPK